MNLLGRVLRKNCTPTSSLHTFHQLLHNKKLLESVKNVSEKVLMDYLAETQVPQLNAAQDLMPFRTKFKKYIADNVDSL